MKSVAFRRLALFCAVALLPSCSGDSVLDPSVRPDLPPADALNADFSFFHGRTPAEGGTTENWELSLGRILAAEAAMTPSLEVPWAALEAATSVTGTRDGNVWRWPFSIEIDGAPFDGELRSGISGGQYTWDLYINAPEHDPPLTNFLWAAGIVGSTGREGQWLIADSDNATSDVAAGVYWVQNDVGDLAFEFSSEQGVLWQYHRQDDISVVTHIVNNTLDYRVTWHSDTGTGSTWTAATNITVCWNAQLHDVECPE